MYRRANATHEHIIHVAWDMFFENGYENTHTKEIALAANVSEALLYKYFSTKEKLYIEVFQRAISSLSKEAETYFNPDQPLQWLYQFSKDLLSPDESTPMVAIMFSQITRLQVKHFTMQSIETGEEIHRILERIISKGQKMGQITDCDTPDRLSFLYYRFLVGLIVDDLFFPMPHPSKNLDAIKSLFAL